MRPDADAGLMEDLNQRNESAVKRPAPFGPNGVALAADPNLNPNLNPKGDSKGDPSHAPITPEGLILPRKPVNPCLLSTDRQNLHRELLFNEKIGKNVLNQKTELQKAWQKHKEHQTKMEDVRAKLESKSPLERVIAERARRLESMEALNKESQSSEPQPEFIRVHAKVCANKMDPK